MAEWQGIDDSRREPAHSLQPHGSRILGAIPVHPCPYALAHSQRRRRIALSQSQSAKLGILTHSNDDWFTPRNLSAYKVGLQAANIT